MQYAYNNNIELAYSKKLKKWLTILAGKVGLE